MASNDTPGWLGRSLANYKALHAKAAADRGVGKQLEAAKTLTEAKKIIAGKLRKQTR